jgi:serine/threonine protein kinase
VKLYEVIEDEESGVVYLVMELVKKGAVLSKRYWRYENFTSGQAGHGTYLSAQKAKHYFRQLVQAVHYCKYSI